MKILAVDTSANVASVAVTEDNMLLGEYYINNGKTHSQKLMPLLNGILKGLELEAEEIDIFSAAIGPGSFTGLRIGVTTIKSLAYALKKPVVGVSTLDSLAYNLNNWEYNICPIMDARNNQVFSAIYNLREGYPIRLTDYMALHIDELKISLKEMNTRTMFLGDGVLVHKNNLINEFGDMCAFPDNNILFQRAASVAQLAYMKYLQGDTESCFELTPFYLRKSQAERELEKRKQML